MIAKETRQIENHPNDGCRNGGERCGEFEFVMGRLHERATRENEQKRGQESEPCHQGGGHSPRQKYLFGTDHL
ncbi:hypothetical protein D3C84_1221160 [compost metagenome]